MHPTLTTLSPHWGAPDKVKAFCTNRLGGVSVSPYASLNLANHVNDDADHVSQNQQLLNQALSLPSPPRWLNQTHSTQVLSFSKVQAGLRDGDGALTADPHVICSVLTADCLPLLVCNIDGSLVGAIHAGWKGLADGIIPKAIKKMLKNDVLPQNILVWIGPHISQSAYEVGQDIKTYFESVSQEYICGFNPGALGKWHLDMSAIARLQLRDGGIHLNNIYEAGICTYSNPDYFSYRRNGETGRQASMIWLSE